MTGRLIAVGLIVGWVAVVAAFFAGTWWAGRRRDDTCHNCEATVGRLSAELAREAANSQLWVRLVAAQHGYIDQLEHDWGPAMVAEVEQWLQGGES